MLSFRLFVGFFNFSCATEALYYSSPSPDYSDRKFQLLCFSLSAFLSFPVIILSYHPGNRCTSKDFLITFTTSAQSIAATKPILMTNNKQLGMTITIADRHKSTLGLIKTLSYHSPSLDSSFHFRGKRKKVLW